MFEFNNGITKIPYWQKIRSKKARVQSDWHRTASQEQYLVYRSPSALEKRVLQYHVQASSNVQAKCPLHTKSCKICWTPHSKEKTEVVETDHAARYLSMQYMRPHLTWECLMNFKYWVMNMLTSLLKSQPPPIPTLQTPPSKKQALREFPSTTSAGLEKKT